MIMHNPNGSKKIYTLNELYSYLQDVFDEPEFMKYEIPIEAKQGAGRHPTDSQKQYSLINHWNIDKKSLKYLKGGALKTTEVIKA